MRTTDSDLELIKELDPEQLRNLSTKVIEELIGALNIQKARIDSDVHDAQIDYRERKTYANPKWFKKAVAASKNKGVQLQILHRELGDRRREEKREDTLRYERTFMDVAKTQLKPEQYETIVMEAMLRCDMLPGCKKEF
jgi:hypothetical protein